MYIYIYIYVYIYIHIYIYIYIYIYINININILEGVRGGLLDDDATGDNGNTEVREQLSITLSIYLSIYSAERGAGDSVLEGVGGGLFYYNSAVNKRA